jgi:ATP-binding cassette, subfamily B, bacterial
MSVKTTSSPTNKGMTRTVYAYLMHTYGRLPQIWVSVAMVVVHTLLMRVVSVIIIAQLAGQIVAGETEAAKTSILLYLYLSILALLLRLGKELLAVRAENKEYARLMVEYYKKIVNKDMSFFRDHQTGYIAGTFRQHIDSGLDLTRMLRGELLQGGLALVAPVIVLFIASWQIGLVVLGVLIVQVAYITWSSAATNKYRLHSHEIYRKISGIFADDVTNIVAYKTSGQQHKAISGVQSLANEEYQAFWQRRKTFAILDTPRDIITVIGAAIAYWLIVSAQGSTAQSVALIVLTLTYMVQIFQQLIFLPDALTRHDDLITKLYPTFEYIGNMDESIRDPKTPKSLIIRKAAIDINNVTFAYPDERSNSLPVFAGLNLHIDGGEQIGVVGLSGAGKSTLASLLMRFDDITAGSIEIDGTDIRDVRQADLREHIAYVPQEPLLFHRTIRENLQYFSRTGNEADMIRAAKAAHAHEFISKLPRGYDTLVGERGIKLSGGQKQRVVIARAILKDAPIMLFDEATSALDSESEKIIQSALPKILGKRTAIVIAHRLSTVAGLDRIIVMHDGTIAEQGTHDELLTLKGRYYSLWQKQTAKAE